MEEHTDQGQLAAVNDSFPRSRMQLRDAKVDKKTGDISALHKIFLLTKAAKVVFMFSTKENDMHVFAI